MYEWKDLKIAKPKITKQCAAFGTLIPLVERSFPSLQVVPFPFTRHLLCSHSYPFPKNYKQRKISQHFCSRAWNPCPFHFYLPKTFSSHLYLWGLGQLIKKQNQGQKGTKKIWIATRLFLPWRLLGCAVEVGVRLEIWHVPTQSREAAPTKESLVSFPIFWEYTKHSQLGQYFWKVLKVTELPITTRHSIK